MLRLSKLTDYALLVTDYLAKRPDTLNSMSDISKQTHVPRATVRKILNRLLDAGIVRSVRGIHGGYQLASTADSISIARVIDAMEGPLAMTECNQPGGLCSMECHCQLRGNWIQINQWVNSLLKSMTLADLARPMSFEVFKTKISAVDGKNLGFYRDIG
ncbi:MAG TPA: SUF system Fe-S cluster assembly regulator [Gammaproteobacteria bacterium]